jgi:hypothetical protein
MGLEGTILTMAASPDLMNLGRSSVDLPVRRSIFSRRVSNLHAMWAVWQSRTGATCRGRKRKRGFEADAKKLPLPVYGSSYGNDMRGC